MVDKIPHRTHASCPYDEKILHYYDGVYESVYIILHPFLKPRTLDMRLFGPNWIDPKRPKMMRPSDTEIYADSDEISWKDVIELSRFSTLAEIDVGLRTSILGIKKEFQNELFSSMISQLFSINGILSPSEGELDLIVLRKVLKALKKLGANHLYVSDEFGEGRTRFSIGEETHDIVVPSHGCINAFDNKFLLTTHWDSHCSLLCSSKAIIDEILNMEQLEGFYCTSNTEVYWGLYDL